MGASGSSPVACSSLFSEPDRGSSAGQKDTGDETDVDEEMIVDVLCVAVEVVESVRSNLVERIHQRIVEEVGEVPIPHVQEQLVEASAATGVEAHREQHASATLH